MIKFIFFSLAIIVAICSSQDVNPYEVSQEGNPPKGVTEEVNPPKGLSSGMIAEFIKDHVSVTKRWLYITSLYGK